MGNIVLKSLYAANFASFAEPVTFTMIADRTKKEFPATTFQATGDTLNKIALLYGANGSGKTFFCKILREIQRLLEWSQYTTFNNAQFMNHPRFKGLSSPVATFAFDDAYKDKSVDLGLDIVLDDTTYHYQFSMIGQKVCSEQLTKKRRRTEVLLQRISSSYKDVTLRSELKQFESTLHVVKEEALCLPMAALLNNPLATRIVKAILAIPVLNMAAPRLEPREPDRAFSEERLRKYAEVIRNADPTIMAINAKVEEEEKTLFKNDSDDFENREIIEKTTRISIETKHYDSNNRESSRSLNFFRDESLGTVKLFTALPYLYDVLEDGGVLVVDEIENGLHLSLVKDILRLFTDPASNPHNAQLICTSHQPLLVSSNIRRDQVWVACKNALGVSDLRRVSDLSTSRANVNLANKLIEGAFGCNPDHFFV